MVLFRVVQSSECNECLAAIQFDKFELGTTASSLILDFKTLNMDIRACFIGQGGGEQQGGKISTCFQPKMTRESSRPGAGSARSDTAVLVLGSKYVENTLKAAARALIWSQDTHSRYWTTSDIAGKDTYIAPLLDLHLGHMLDSHPQPVPVTDPGVDDAEAALAQHRAHLVQLLKLLSWRPEHSHRLAVSRPETRDDW